MDVPAEILSRIDALAAKLGVTIEYLWPCMVRYFFARGVSALIGWFGLLILTLVWYRIMMKNWKSWAEKDQEALSGRYDDDGLGRTMAAVILFGILMTFVVGFGIWCLTDAVPCLVAPEYAALQSLIK